MEMMSVVMVLKGAKIFDCIDQHGLDIRISEGQDLRSEMTLRWKVNVRKRSRNLTVDKCGKTQRQ